MCIKLNNYLVYATYMDDKGFREDFGVRIIARSAEDAFNFLDDRARELGLKCIVKSVQRDDDI